MNTTQLASLPPRNSSDLLGQIGEDYACQYMTELGWSILDRNWRCRFGEIDAVAICPAQHTEDPPILVFIEVKTRSSFEYGDPLEAITPLKCAHMRKSALSWMAQHHTNTPQLVRFDGIGILVKQGKVQKLTHVRRIL
ncbi:YraN family protein [Alloscardovia criceti]|uniref:YraN family protein n=1 Tax=Alloscardovia criceti TaxID=356828 RepID=UPI000363FD3C|nr:YraN family protein [Alloscardovia criceti]